MIEVDLVIVGAGAAGLWAARCAGVRARARAVRLRLALVDGREKVGAKILMSGGTRCNLTHTEVSERDYRGGHAHRVRQVLRAHPSSESLRVFTGELGVAVRIEEHTDKIFPADDRAATVLAALLRAAEKAGVPLLRGRRWTGLEHDRTGWKLRLVDSGGREQDALAARRLLVCTGGCSYPRTGSDGSAWEILRRLGHTIVTPVPALTPLLLRDGFHSELSGISLPARLRLQVDGRPEIEAEGPLLFAHFGLSGPAALDLSGPWARARADRPASRTEVFASFLPGESSASLERRWLEEARLHPARTAHGFLRALPHRLADALVSRAGADPHRPLAQTPRDDRRAVIAQVTDCPLPVEGVAGFRKAEVTSGGIPLDEVDGGLESRLLPGVHFAGEVLHVDGRLGGFNFQWAWSSGAVAAEAAVDRLARDAADVRRAGD